MKFLYRLVSIHGNTYVFDTLATAAPVGVPFSNRFNS